MTGDLRVEGAEKLARLSRILKETGDKELRAELYRGIQRAGKPVKEAVKAHAGEGLPAGGGRGVRTYHRATGARLGLKRSGFANRGGHRSRVESVAQRVARANVTIKTRGGRDPSVVVTAKDSAGHKIDLERLDKGQLNHPLFGNRSHWFTQRVQPGWFTRPAKAAIPEAQRELAKVMDEIAAKVDARIGR